MERASEIIEEIYRILGPNFKPKIIDQPIYGIEVKSLDITLDTEILDYKIERVSGRVIDEKILFSPAERFIGKILSASVDMHLKVNSSIEIINNVFIKKHPVLWKSIPDEMKAKLLYEIKTKSSSYSEGLKIIGIYEDIPIGRIKTMMVDENTGILSFNLKDSATEEKRSNLLVFKFIQDDKLRSIVF